MKKGLLIVCVLQLVSLSVLAQGTLKEWNQSVYLRHIRPNSSGKKVGRIQAYEPPPAVSSAPYPYIKKVFTGLTGFCDFQINGGSPKYIAINPSDSNRIHVTYMSAGDSNNVGSTRRVGYAYSADGGETWTSLGSIGDVAGASGAFPSLALLPNQNGDIHAAIACHAKPDMQRSFVFIDQYSEGLGLFQPTALNTAGFGDFQPVWPSLLASKDGSKMWMLATRPYPYFTSYCAVWDSVTKQFGAYVGSLKTEAGRTLRSYGIYGMAISESGSKVAMYYIDVAGYLNLNYTESSDSGQTFPNFKTITPYPTIINGDTLGVFVGCDAVYVGEELHIVFSSCKPYMDQRSGQWGADITGQGIWHWSKSAGFTRAVDTTRIQTLLGSSWNGYRMPGGGLPQTNTFPIDYPSIGTGPDGRLFCVFQVARQEVSAASFNYYTVLYTVSNDGGLTWSEPVDIETDAATDFRYPSVAKYNPANEFNVVYQKDSEPGSGSYADSARVTQASLVFAKLTTTLAVDDDPPHKVNAYKLAQNYPNPFNPSTVIPFSLPKAERVELNVYDLLGRRVAVLLNERKSAGSYQVSFNANRLASGIYFYRIRAGSFVETKKMVFLR
ncbi:MAG: T9SS type A sorting domain-containing protein [Chlorobiales bacterium]|nr:T9SS type A sorting domain-containing protein [Chlorobiales bacterium]